MVKVLYFGIAQDITGSVSEEFEAQDTANLCRKIMDRHPDLGKIRFRLALNKVLLKGESALQSNDIVAVLPPFAGG